MRYIVTVILLFTLPLFSLAKSETPLEEFKTGVALSEEGDYKTSLRKLSSSRSGLLPIDDYVLLYMAKAHLELGEAKQSVAAARELVEKYPGSVLVPEARAIELKNLLTGDWDPLIERLSEYIKHYPSEKEMRLFYGTLLQKRGREDEALAVLKPLYIDAGEFEAEAGDALQDIKLTRKELLERASNLMTARRYEEAEKILDPMYKSGGDLRKPAAQKLALIKFRQRKYNKASRFFIEADDLYNAARSYIRSGEMNNFYLTLDKMVTRQDAKGGVLLVAFANEVRRDGNLQDALSLLDLALDKFPLVREDALWSKGWGLYASGRFKEAVPVFEELVTSYPANKYRYWKARARGHIGEDETEQLSDIAGNDFYAFLAGTKTGVYAIPPNSKVMSSTPPTSMKRINMLIEAGLVGYACKELDQLTSLATRNAELLDIARKLIELKEYRKAISVMTRLPEQSRPLNILYPAAFWPMVQSTSSQYELDPYLVLSLIREESRFDPKALSPVGAIGLMQLMPETAERTARRLHLHIDGNDSISKVENNITLGTYYLSGLMSEFKSAPVALAAYNAGRTRVKQWLGSGQYESIDEFIEDIPYEETRNYVKRIVTSYFHYQISYGSGPEEAARIL